MTKFRLINIKSKFRTLLKLFPLLIFLNACEPGCVESYQFDSENTYVDSKPTADGIFGGPYSNASGGENASWHKTGLRSDGSQLILEIRGAWTAWEDIESGVDLKNLPECTMCAKKNGVDNCICKIDEVSIPEKDTFGEPLSGVDCGAGSAYQEIPSSCSCTNAHGTINDFGTYFIATNYQEKSEALKLPDDQNPCKYTEGFGLYVGLFGKNGNTMPLRAYQVYPTQKVCDITTTVEGKCIDDAGEDQIKYVYRSPNGQIFIKDDRSGNNGSDTDPGDDEYHQAGEFIKFISSDRYYHDNFGGYDVNFMGGFFRDHDSGLLEYIVGSVEDIVLGKISTIGGKREGGAIEFLYNAIVKDSSFILIVQMCLIMYVVLFGIYVLSGGIQISNKEISKRVLKIALVIFFTTETSWYFYNQLVVGLFKDSMDTIIAIFMNGSDKLIDQTSLIISSQVDRANSLSYSTRFSYVDGVIKKLLSAATSKKIWSLFFGEWFGLIYIPAIYALIFAFVFIMLTAAFVYISALLRLVFVLCLGPIFMVTVLFNKTDEIFKRWISFMASQAVQIIALFLILYLFVALIDINFNDLLSYRACTKSINFGLFNINFMVSHANRGLVDWVASFAKIGTLLFLLKMIMEKIPGFAGQLVSVGGQAADTSNAFISNTNKSAFGLAKSVMGMAGRAAGKAVTKGLPYSLSKGMDVARFTGVNKLIPPNPISFASGMYRDRQINNIINAQRKEGKAQGKSGADLNQFIRKGTYGEINKQMAESGNKLNILGVNDHSAIAKILDKQLVEDPLKKAIKDETSKMKKECKEKGTKMPLSKAELNEALRPRIADWAKKNSSIDKSKFLDLLDESKYSSLVKKHGALSSTQAAKMFAGDKDGTNQYLRHLKDLESRKQEKRDSESKLGKLFRLNAIKDKARGLQGNTAYNPKMARENFVRKKDWEERRMENRSKYGLFKRGLDFVGINPEKSGIEHINVLDQLKRKDRIKLLVTESGVMMERESDINALTEGLEGAHKATIDQIQAKYDKEIKGLDKFGKDKCGKDKNQAIEEAKKQKDNIERKLANPYEIDEARKDIDNMVDLVLQSTLADKISELKAQKESGVMMERESDINALTEGLEGAHKATIDQIQAKYDKEIKGLDKCGKDKCGEDKSQAIEEAKKQKDNIERKLANPYEIDEAKKDIDNMVDLVLQSTLADKISELKAQKDDTEAKISLLKSTFASLLDVEKDELLRLESQASTMESIISTSQSELSEVKSRIDIHKNS